MGVVADFVPILVADGLELVDRRVVQLMVEDGARGAVGDEEEWVGDREEGGEVEGVVAGEEEGASLFFEEGMAGSVARCEENSAREGFDRADHF